VYVSVADSVPRGAQQGSCASVARGSTTLSYAGFRAECFTRCAICHFAAQTCSATAGARQGGTLTYLKFAGAPKVLYASGRAHFVWINELRRRPLLDPAVNVLRWGRGHMGMPSVPRTFCLMSGLLVLPTLSCELGLPYLPLLLPRPRVLNGHTSTTVAQVHVSTRRPALLTAQVFCFTI